MADAMAQMPPENLLEKPPNPESDVIVGWGVVKGQPPGWLIIGLYHTHAHADEAAAEVGGGHYAR